jgi:homoprotocatechuate degradation regulator HpaR
MRPLARSLPLKLLMAREAVMERFRPHLNARGITEQQWRVLRALDETDEMDAGRLAEAICLLKPSLSRILADLAERGLVQKRDGLADRRLRTVSITDAGRALVADMSATSEAEYRRLEKELGRDGYRTLMRVLDETLATLKPPPT